MVYDIERAKDKCESLADYRIKDLDDTGIVLPFFENSLKNKGLNNNEIIDAVLEGMEKGERFVGICSDSSALMCREIDKNNLPIFYWRQSVKTSYGTSHAVVVCFDKEGNWIVLNGKRPRDFSEDFKIVPKEYFANGTFKFE
jgi:hypothetical protein